MPKEGDLRCVCRKHPLLGKYGVDRRGRLYVHVKVFKQERVFGEIILEGGGTARIRCRECDRWHVIRIQQPHGVDFTPEDLPQSMPIG